MNIHIEYKGKIYIIPSLEYESYETNYERAVWIANKEPKTEEAFNSYLLESLKWIYQLKLGVKY